jgi:hypothetical protein
VGEIGSYENLLKFYVKVVQGLEDGVTELFMHPCENSDEPVMKDGAMDFQKRVWEFEVLQDERFLNAVKDSGAELVGWKDV